jgi:hypothetical protein
MHVDDNECMLLLELWVSQGKIKLMGLEKLFKESVLG